ncbi:MAG TPA: cytochrome c [Chromatiales bacterium]|nr:cytochrome c [Chromatiales bacterium]
MKTTWIAIAALCAGASLPVSQAADAGRGKQLHDKHCIDCHSGMVGGDGTLLYTRKNRRVHSYDALIKQINRCDQSLGLKWFPEDVRDVAAYLNREFYKFPVKR